VFKAWFRDSFPNLKVPTKNELKEDLSIRWKEHMLKNGKFKNIREKSVFEKEDQDDDDEEEEESDNETDIDELLEN
jgi:hypothetical protein